MVTSERSTGLRVLLVAGVLLAGFNLRPAVTSVGALMPALRAELALSGTTAGMLTALPTLCFAALGFTAPALARRFGYERVLGGAFVLLASGVAVRAAAGGAGQFLAGSAVSLAGIAAANVLGPPLVRRWFPRRVGLMTGLYAMSISAGVALPAALSVPLAQAAGGWRTGIAVWAPVAVLAALPWLLPALHRDAPATTDTTPDDGAVTGPGRVVTVALTLFFGLQSLAAFVLLGWMPAILVDAGVPGTTAGLMLALTAALAVPFGLALPVLAGRARARPWLLVTITGAGLAGWTGLLLDPSGPVWLWAALLASGHCAYPLAIAMVRVRSAGPAAELRLSGLVQTGGYTFAVLGPLATGVLRDATAGWTVPIALVLALLVLQLGTGLVAVGAPGRARAADTPEPVGAAR